ncbi:MAG TPA: hypothetical protein VE819_00225 [Steroidobacteraceae bacterium]|nr:hypothetical protein [Steroidobacteraceae bacterium]
MARPPDSDHVLHNTEARPERDVLEESRHGEQHRRHTPVRGSEGEQIERGCQRKSAGRHQCVPCAAARRRAVGHEAAEERAERDGQAAGEADDHTDGREVKSERTVEVSSNENPGAVGRKRRERESNYDVGRGPAEKQGVGNCGELARFGADRETCLHAHRPLGMSAPGLFDQVSHEQCHGNARQADRTETNR